jgi:hypothetical protein
VINDAIRSELSESGLPKSLWDKCAAHAAFTLNVISFTAADVSTWKLWSGKEPPLNLLQRFCTVGYAYIPKATQNGKLDQQSNMVILLGYGEVDSKKAYKSSTL